MKTIDYLVMIQEMNHRNGKPASDYRAAELLDVAKQTVSRYRKGTTFDDKTAMKAANLLSIDPAIIFADMQAERAKNEEARNIWENIGQIVRNQSDTPVTLSVAFFIAVTLSPFETSTYQGITPLQLCANLILCKITRLYLAHTHLLLINYPYRLISWPYCLIVCAYTSHTTHNPTSANR